MSRERHLAARDPAIEPSRRAVRRVRAQSRSGTGGDHRFGFDGIEPLIGMKTCLHGPFALQPDDLGIDHRTNRGLRNVRPAQTGRGDVREHRRAGAKARLKVASHGGFQRTFFRAPSLLDHPAQPVQLVLNTGFLRRRDRRQFEMRMGVHEPRCDRGVAQVDVSGPPVRWLDGPNTALADRQQGVGDRFTLDREDPASPECPRP